MIPWALSATSIPYNLPGINGRLRLDGPTLANDLPRARSRTGTTLRSRRSTRSCNLPDTKITPVYRSDGSGTTYNFTEYLSTVSPAFKSAVGVNTSVSWKTGVGARGSSGVAGRRHEDGGRADLRRRRLLDREQVQFATIKNRAGKFATPGLRGIQRGRLAAAEEGHELNQLKIVDPPRAAGPLAYPIVTFTYVIVPTSSSKAADLRKLIYWAVTRGQKFGPPLLFQPLPVPVQAFAFREIKKIQG